MDIKERFIKLAQAAPETLERVDRILEGRPASSGDDPDLRSVTFKEAAVRLGVSRPTVYRLVSRHELPTVRIGELDRIPVRALVEYGTRPSRRAYIG